MDAVFGTVLRILEFILAFGLLVFLHELGHYLMSKLAGVEVEEFGFGFPPRLVKLFQFKETEFTLNWIPFGAFVRPKGENDPSVAGGLAAASPWARLGVLFGGPVMNLVTGLLLFTIVFARMGAPDTSRVLIMDVVADSPAGRAGIEVNDIVLKVGDEPINSTEELSSVVKANLGREIAITLERGGQPVTLNATPRANPPAGQGALGITMSNPYLPISAAQALPYAAGVTLDQGRQLLSLPVMLLRGQMDPDQGRLVGPKGIYDIFQAARDRDVESTSVAQEPTQPRDPTAGLNTLAILATISIALGYTNLLPIPALDGGRILFVLPELLFRRRVPARYENMIHLVGFTLLIVLMIYVTTQDFINPVIP